MLWAEIYFITSRHRNMSNEFITYRPNDYGDLAVQIYY